MSKPIMLLATALLFVATAASAQVTMSTNDAIDLARKKGRVKVLLAEESAEPLREQIHRPNAKIYLEAWVEKDLAEKGCKRFGLRFTSPGSKLELTGGGTQDLDLTMGMNLCANGKPPQSDMPALPPAPTK